MKGFLLATAHHFARLLLSLASVTFSSTLLRAELPRCGSVRQDRVQDVSLNSQFVLEGCLIDTFGRVLTDTPVTIRQNRKIVWSGRTDPGGRFSVPHLASGVYRVDSDRISILCRIWSINAAPPQAGRSLLLMRDLLAQREPFESQTLDNPVRMAGMALPRLTVREVHCLISP